LNTLSPLHPSPAATTSGPDGSFGVRPATPADREACGRIFWEAFAGLASRHDFPIEPSDPGFTERMFAMWLGHPGFDCTVLEREGEVVGSAVVDNRCPIRGIGPVTVAPSVQDAGGGRLLMEAIMGRSIQQGAPGMRLVQTAYHYRSLALYSKLGFRVREPLSVVAGAPPRVSLPGHEVRSAVVEDLEACDTVCRRVHGIDRRGEVEDALRFGSALVVEREGRVTGYATGLGYGMHAAGRERSDLQALIGAAERFLGLGILVPSRDGELLRWCLAHGLRIVQQSHLMTIGSYQEPKGAWLPSILF